MIWDRGRAYENPCQPRTLNLSFCTSSHAMTEPGLDQSRQHEMVLRLLDCQLDSTMLDDK